MEGREDNTGKEEYSSQKATLEATKKAQTEALIEERNETGNSRFSTTSTTIEKIEEQQISSNLTSLDQETPGAEKNIENPTMNDVSQVLVTPSPYTPPEPDAAASGEKTAIFKKTPIAVVEAPSQAEQIGLKQTSSPFKETAFETHGGPTIASMFTSDPEKVKENYWQEHQKALKEARGTIDASQPDLTQLLDQWENGINLWIHQSREDGQVSQGRIEILLRKMLPSFPNLVGLFEAMKIMKEAISYKNAFFQRQKEIASNLTKQPFIQFAQTLNEKTPSIQNNLQRLIRAAEEVRILQAQRKECLEEVAATTEPSIQNKWNQAIKNIDEAIDKHLLYAQQVREGKFTEARKTRAEGVGFLRQAQQSRIDALIAKYSLERDQALAAGGPENEERAERLSRAIRAVTVASENFSRAFTEEVSGEQSEAFKQAGYYRIEGAQALVEGDQKKAYRLLEAVLTCELAATNSFSKTYREQNIAEEVREAYKQLGYSQLKHAEALAKGDIRIAKRLEEANNVVDKAITNFSNAFRKEPSEKQKIVLRKVLSYSLERAQALAKGDLEKAGRLWEEALECQLVALSNFSNAFREEELIEEARAVYNELGYSGRRYAEALAKGDRVALSGLFKAREAIDEAISGFFNSFTAGVRKEEEKEMLRKVFSYSLEQAQALAEGNQVKVKCLRDAIGTLQQGFYLYQAGGYEEKSRIYYLFERAKRLANGEVAGPEDFSYEQYSRETNTNKPLSFYDRIQKSLASWN